MNKEIDFQTQIQTLRTDDYARTFQTFTRRSIMTSRLRSMGCFSVAEAVVAPLSNWTEE
ncbi:MAG: hypothetical protein ACYS72_03875 [Planctomycetota bacterium]